MLIYWLLWLKGLQFGLWRIYPYEKDLRLCTDDDTLLPELQASTSDQNFCGVKGTTILFKFVYTFISSTGVDIVHAVFEGVTKKLIQVWIHKDFSGKDLSMSKYVHTISTRMETLQPPEFMRRCPRSDINES